VTRIHILPDALASQIAAGEVVERPASVVKELVENSLDAGAKTVSVRIEKSGKDRIRVVDDGCGMSAEDARLALERHATSKLHSVSDLAAIETLGFRGEALPSIASVSELTLVTKEAASEAGVKIQMEGGRMVGTEAIGCAPGTSVDVRQLFFNVPARRKFLRSDVTEASHIADLVSNLAAAQPGVQFQLEHGKRLLVEAPRAGSRLERLYQIEGAWAEDAIAVDESAGSLRVSAWLAPPAEERGGSNRLHLFVNGRHVRDRILSHAVMEAYRRASSKPGTPRAYLFLELPAGKLDVNVHPSKAEVRFVDQGFVHHAVYSIVANALRGDARAPGVWLAGTPAAHAVGEPQPVYTGAPGQPVLRSGGGGLAVVEALSGGATEARPRAFAEWATEPPTSIGQLRHSYIIAVDGQDLWLVDQHAAHERVLFEELLERAQSGSREQQMLLQPIPLELTAGEQLVFQEELPRIAGFGFDVEPFGERSYLVRAVPAALAGFDPVKLLRSSLFEPERECRSSSISELGQRLAARVACHAAIKINQPLSPDKMRYLLEKLWRAGEPSVCPHGRPTTLRVGREQIERSFGRA
jgi:DNA mismatch repair protein MutL